MKRGALVPDWLLDPESATAYALEHFPDAYRDQQFEEDAEERVSDYSDFANEVNESGAETITMYRAFDVPLESVDFLNLGKSWSAGLGTARCFGGGGGQGWAKGDHQCQVVVEGAIAVSDVDWPYSFESFLMYGHNQWEIAPVSHAPILITAFFPMHRGRARDEDRQALDHPIAGNAGKALEEWEPVSRNAQGFRSGTSPLVYPRFSAPALRFALFETEASAPPPDAVYFAETRKAKRKKNGDRMMRKGVPVMETVPDADADVLGFVDYHELAPGHFYIDLVTTRHDWRGMGVMRILLDEFFAAHADAVSIDFGDIVAEQLHNYFLKKREEPAWRGRVYGKIR